MRFLMRSEPHFYDTSSPPRIDVPAAVRSGSRLWTTPIPVRVTPSGVRAADSWTWENPGTELWPLRENHGVARQGEQMGESDARRDRADDPGSRGKNLDGITQRTAYRTYRGPKIENKRVQDSHSQPYAVRAPFFL